MADETRLTRDDTTGRFLPGNSAAKGHRAPQAQMVHELRQTFLASIGTDKLAEVIRHHIDLILSARSGRDAAALLELLYGYALGKPVQAVSMDLTTTDATPARTSAVPLDATDVAALEAIRAKLTQPAQVIDAEVIQ